ncbi:MAG: PD-(D/E)XK nuclease family protein [Deltaproteobacteria bacterium]|nr:PD-(D/E)XK nuclease family protein [Deltaproteobacteria bacterium]
MINATRRLLICRTRAHQRARLRDVDARVWTFGDLKERLCAWGALKGGVARDDLGARLLAAAALCDDSDDGALLPRLAPALDALRQELVHARTDALTLLDALGPDDDADNEQGRMAEVRRLLTRVRRVEIGLKAANVDDDSLALDRARGFLARGDRPGFLAGVSAVVVEDALEATALEVEVLRALSISVPVEVRLPIDDVAKRESLLGVDAVFRAIEATPGLEVSSWNLSGDGPLAPFRAALFGGGDVVVDAPVSVRLCTDAAAEALLVAGVVAAWRRSSRSIAVAVRDERQVPTFLDALRRHGLPVRRRRRSLIESPAARLLMDLAALRLDGAPRERLLAVLTNPARRACLGTDDGARVLSTLRKAAARRDVEDQTKPSGGYRHRLLRLRDRDPERTADVAFALAAIEPVLATAHTMPLRGSLAGHLAAWLRLTRDVVDEARGLGGAEVLEIVARLNAGVARVGLPPAAVDLHALLRLVERELVHQPWLDDDVDVDDDAVEVLTVPELCGRRFDHLAIARVVEGELPQPPGRAGLLGDTDRARLNRLLGKKVLRLAEEERLGDASSTSTGLEGCWWLTALETARVSLLLTAPRVDVRGREHAPSAFLLDAVRVLGRSPDELEASGEAGAAVDVAEDPRQRLTRQARSVADDDAVIDVGDLAVRARLASRMVKERARWFRRTDLPHEQRRAPYAFAVDKARVARAFGGSFGLLEKKPLTPTRLEAMAECRMHGFVQQVLRLDVDPEAGNAIEARVQGTLGHNVLERFYAERKAQRVPLTRMNGADSKRLLQIVDDEAAPLLAGKTTGHLPALGAAVEFLKRTLLRVTMTLARRPAVEGVEPVDFELQIGATVGGRPPTLGSVAVEVIPGRKLWIGGVIDRVDEGSGGRAVVDYKTMSSSRVKQKASSSSLLQTHFQLFVYLRLLEHWRPTHPSVQLHGHLISLKDGGTSKDIGLLADLRARVMDDERADSLGRAIGRVVLPILDGTLPPDANDRCTDCRLQRVCRVPNEGIYASDPDELAEEETA